MFVGNKKGKMFHEEHCCVKKILQALFENNVHSVAVILLTVMSGEVRLVRIKSDQGIDLLISEIFNIV